MPQARRSDFNKLLMLQPHKALDHDDIQPESNVLPQLTHSITATVHKLTARKLGFNLRPAAGFS